ncbi:MAG: enoyl-CoA hydratase-related protein [Xanthomonadales bacterium]|nr:enoyl-CoA hydratase-related protein [Xanthomonadales bacterium]
MSSTMSNIPSLTDAQLEINDRVATLKFNRDDVRNALTGTALVDDIVTVVDWINSESSISCLIITGNGKAFCSGGNIKEMRDDKGTFGGTPAQIAEKYRRGIQRMSLAMHSIEIPVIAAVNGPAIGAGFDLACMCDIRLGCENTLLGETFINLGIIPGDGGAWFLQRLVGYQKAAELTFSGRLVKAEEALQIGLLLELVTANQLLTKATELAQSFAAKSPQALRMTQRLMKSAQRLELGDFLDLSSIYQASCHHTQDYRRAVNGFLDKTTVEFKGD